MTVYVDTALLVKSYIREWDSPEAVALLDAAGLPLLYSHLHAIEVPNAICLKQFRGEITQGQRSAALRFLQADLDDGRLVRPNYDLVAVFNRAVELAAKHSHVEGTRSMDVLHVAAALESGCGEIISLDVRQRKLAVRAGLRVLPRKMHGTAPVSG